MNQPLRWHLLRPTRRRPQRRRCCRHDSHRCGRYARRRDIVIQGNREFVVPVKGNIGIFEAHGVLGEEDFDIALAIGKKLETPTWCDVVPAF